MAEEEILPVQQEGSAQLQGEISSRIYEGHCKIIELLHLNTLHDPLTPAPHTTDTAREVYNDITSQETTPSNTIQCLVLRPGEFTEPRVPNPKLLYPILMKYISVKIPRAISALMSAVGMETCSVFLENGTELVLNRLDLLLIALHSWACNKACGASEPDFGITPLLLDFREPIFFLWFRIFVMLADRQLDGFVFGDCVVSIERLLGRSYGQTEQSQVR